MLGPLLCAYLVVNCLIPGYICRVIGETKNMPNAPWWGVLLGWLGVLAVVVLPDPKVRRQHLDRLARERGEIQ